MTIRVLLADDQLLLLKALATILGANPDIEVVAQAGNGAEAVEAAVKHKLDVAVLDIRMPVMDGIAAAQTIMAAHPSVRVLMLTTFDDEDLVEAALAAGVHGFLLKDADPEELAAAVRAVATGESVLASRVTGHVLESYRAARAGRGELTPEQRQGLSLVTPREKDVLLLVARGASNAEIAEELHVAETTVKTHVSSLMSKLHARDRVALVLTAQKACLV